jgi:hypothetical protein
MANRLSLKTVSAQNPVASKKRWLLNSSAYDRLID